MGQALEEAAGSSPVVPTIRKPSIMDGFCCYSSENRSWLFHCDHRERRLQAWWLTGGCPGVAQRVRCRQVSDRLTERVL